MLENYTNTLQDQIGQLSKLLGGQAVGAAQGQQTQLTTSQYDLVTGIEGARSFLQKMLAGTKHIVWDTDASIFYVLQKDSNGNPSRIQIGHFEMELEPTMEEKYVSKEDFAALVAKIDQLIGKEKDNG